MSNLDANRNFAIALSGGGFRATLFHLGVIRFLHDSQLLPRLKHVCSVSGGSILAAHLALNWDRYSGDARQFEDAANEIIGFAMKDVRGQIVRRRILTWLTVFPAAFRISRFALTSLLEQQYGSLYGKATLRDLGSNSAAPHVHLLSTSLTTGLMCAFNQDGFYFHDDVVTSSMSQPDLPVAFAVAASSAFPPLFPPIAMTRERLHRNQEEFPHTQYLCDGGVYDNLGIEKLRWLSQEGRIPGHQLLVSDAEGNFDWEIGKAYSFVVGRNVRASSLLMRRVSRLEYRTGDGESVCKLPIGQKIASGTINDLLAYDVQLELRNIRTDLDRFSPLEVNTLIHHGFSVAREVLGNLKPEISPQPQWIWTPVKTRNAQNNADLLRNSKNRRYGLLSLRDWASWAILMVLATWIAGGVTPYYLLTRAKRKASAEAQVARKEAQSAQKQAQFAQKTSDVFSKDYFAQRHRPIELGSSVGSISGSAGAICCLVKKRNGTARYLLVFADPFESHVGETFLQPAQLDGGRKSDAIGELETMLPVTDSGSNRAIGGLVRLEPDIRASANLKSIGFISATAEPTIGQEVIIVGRSSGVAQAWITSTDTDVKLSTQHGVIELSSSVILVLTEKAPFANSGAPVVTRDGRLVAMVVGAGPSHIVAIRIRDRLSALSVELASE